MRKPSLRETPRKLTATEKTQLQQFERSLAENNLNQITLQKQGGERAIQQKARAQALFSENIHRNGGK